jgi:RND family efflux transporter MFP subunit
MNKKKSMLFLCSLALTQCYTGANEPVVGFTQPAKTIQLAASQTGTLAELSARRGDQVQKGQVLGSLDSEVLLARRALAEAKANSQATVKSAKIKLQRAQHHYAKLTQLHNEGHSGKRELQLSASDLELAETALEAAQEESVISQLSLKQIEAEIRQRQLISPTKGVITDVVLEVGEFVPASEPTVISIADLSKLRVRFYPPTTIAESLHPGDQVRVKLLHTNQSIAASIDVVSPVIDADSNTIAIDVLIDNDKRESPLRSGRRCELLIDIPPVSIGQNPRSHRGGSSR